MAATLIEGGSVADIETIETPAAAGETVAWLRDESRVGLNHRRLPRIDGAGRAPTGRIEQLISEFPTAGDGAHAEQAFLLKAALYVSGNREYERDLRTADLSPVTDTRENSWRFYSDRRRRAMALDVMVDLFGRDDTDDLAHLVAAALQDHGNGWYTTQEVAWSMSALGKWLGTPSDSFGEAELLLAGQAVDPTARSDQGAERSWAIARAGEYASATLSIDDVGDDDLFLIVSSEGVLEGVVPAIGGAGLTLTRTWQRSDGSPLGSFETVAELGDLLYTTVTITNLTGTRQANLAVVDRFPAGWEVENPRLGRDHSPDWVDDELSWSLDSMNVRDDRVEVFGSLGANESATFTYAVRAVTAGTFTMPSAYAEAMYDPRMWARTDSGLTTVNGPWTGLADSDE
jgi:hypothetical protein